MTLARMRSPDDRRAGGPHLREIRIGGRVVNDLATKDRDIAMVFQTMSTKGPS